MPDRGGHRAASGEAGRERLERRRRGATATPTEEWADGLCSSITTWTSSLTSIVDTLKGGNLSKDSLTSAVDEAKSATETFTTEPLATSASPTPRRASRPRTRSTSSSTDIQADMTEIEDAVDGASGVGGVARRRPASISSTLATAGEQVSSTLAGFQDLDAKGELESAFKGSSSCQAAHGGS